MTDTARLKVSLRTTKMLWGRAAAMCAFEECRQPLVMNDENDGSGDYALIGEGCHIVAASPDGPRGQSDLLLNQRNKYPNLILLCRNHHRLIDEQVHSFSVLRLQQIKKEHEAWVKSQTGLYDEKKQRDEEYYVTIVERWEEDCRLENWENWSSDVVDGRPRIAAELIESLSKFNVWLFRRVWPGRHPELEQAFHNFMRILEDFRKTFELHGERKHNYLWVRTFYKISEWDPELYNKLLNEWEAHVDLLFELMVELTRAANWVCDEIRKSILPIYRLEEGRVCVFVAFTMDLGSRWLMPQYSIEERSKQLPYIGFEDFKKKQELKLQSDNEQHLLTILSKC